MKKRGFTLIELAIVLVVIGLLLGMAFKGKSLVDAARVKADANKVVKITTGVSAYVAKYGKLPGISGEVKTSDGTKTFEKGSSAAIYQELMNEGILKAGDFATPSTGTYFQFVGCEEGTNKYTARAISINLGLCVYRSKDKPDSITTASQSATINNPSITGVALCQLETLADDKSFNTGDCRLQSGLTEIPEVDPNWDCGDTTKTSTGATGAWYMCKIY